ncbi:hypothetical protein Tco_0646050 [Tanacetum coccineum]
MDKTRVMENVSLLTQKHLFITTTDKHEVPPMKRLFKVAMLDPSPNLLVHGERLEIWDYQLWISPRPDRDQRDFNLPEKIFSLEFEEENTITHVENAVFDFSIFEYQNIEHDVVKTVVNLSMNDGCVTVNECQKCLELKTELLNKKNFVDKETYDKLCKSFTTLEKHCILNQEIFQQENSVLNQNAPSFTHLFELSELRAQSQAKDTVIVKLKEQIKSLKGNVDDSKVKMDMDEIETLNIELEHRVLLLQPILISSQQPRVCTCSLLKTGTAPDVKDFANLDGVLWHLITLRNFSLTLTNVTTGDKVMGILIDGGPIESLCMMQCLKMVIVQVKTFDLVLYPQIGSQQNNESGSVTS